MHCDLVIFASAAATSGGMVKADQVKVSCLLNFDKVLKRHPASQEWALQGVMQKFFILLLLLCHSLKSCHSKYICAMFF